MPSRSSTTSQARRYQPRRRGASGATGGVAIWVTASSSGSRRGAAWLVRELTAEHADALGWPEPHRKPRAERQDEDAEYQQHPVTAGEASTGVEGVVDRRGAGLLAFGALHRGTRLQGLLQQRAGLVHVVVVQGVLGRLNLRHVDALLVGRLQRVIDLVTDVVHVAGLVRDEADGLQDEYRSLVALTFAVRYRGRRGERGEPYPDKQRGQDRNRPPEWYAPDEHTGHGERMTVTSANGHQPKTPSRGPKVPTRWVGVAA